MTRLREVAGDQPPTGDLTPEVYEAVMARWDTKAAFTDDRHPLRERVLWRTLDETCARTEEILGLDVPDLDMEFRRALVVEKGGDRA